MDKASDNCGAAEREIYAQVDLGPPRLDIRVDLVVETAVPYDTDEITVFQEAA